VGSSIIKELWTYNKPQNIDDINQTLDSINWLPKLKKDLETYQKPLVLIGNGIRLSNTQGQLKRFIEKYKLPICYTYGGTDLIDSKNPLNLGAIGVKGNRGANFALQNCDLLLILGCCLNVPQVGYMGEKFAPKAKKILVDIDKNYNKNIKIDEFINCELREFFKYIL
jgi:acetolactate synthase-1/2/3 large subunit